MAEYGCRGVFKQDKYTCGYFAERTVKINRLIKILEGAPNSVIYDAFARTNTKLSRFNNPVCSVSGGSDSDIMLDICATLDEAKKIKYVFFDTGFEFQATKDHIDSLEEKYGIKIERHRAKKPIPSCVKEYGVPFLNKRVSDYIERLQRYDFKWEEGTFDELYKKYPNCKAALRWWTNSFGEGSRFNIACNRQLKEFLLENPPTFRISNKCCKYAKKASAQECIKNSGADLNITGVRKSEGGARSVAYKSCFSPENSYHIAEFRPLFWFESDTKELYKNAYGITYSDCYEWWGLKRTGCSGCPYARDINKELEATSLYEPKLYRALNNVFGESYEYTEAYRKFQRENKKAR